MGASNTPRPGKYGHRFIHNISKCISRMKLFYFASGLTEISKIGSLYQHPICGTEQASCHYLKQRWIFWQMHMGVIWPQWVNGLSALLKTEYQLKFEITTLIDDYSTVKYKKILRYSEWWPCMGDGLLDLSVITSMSSNHFSSAVLRQMYNQSVIRWISYL